MDICRKYVELHSKIKHIKIAMMTVVGGKNKLRSMPMVTMQTECEGNIWFFSTADSEKIEEIKMHPQVNLVYTDIDSDVFVSISGKAEIVYDQDKINDLWKPNLEEWLPNSSMKDLVLIKVIMEHADYYDGNNLTEIWDTSDIVSSHNEFPELL